ncbi:MAG: adenosylcobinamide-GDP ribazoletransferase, partial [Lentihominibacter sp.]
GTLAVSSAAAAAVIMYAVFIFDFSRPASVFNVLTLFYTIVLVALMKVVTGWAGSSARKQLGGMNGDISGCMIVLGEMAGVILIALLSDIMNLA